MNSGMLVEETAEDKEKVSMAMEGSASLSLEDFLVIPPPPLHPPPLEGSKQKVDGLGGMGSNETIIEH